MSALNINPPPDEEPLAQALREFENQQKKHNALNLRFEPIYFEVQGLEAFLREPSEDVRLGAINAATRRRDYLESQLDELYALMDETFKAVRAAKEKVENLGGTVPVNKPRM
jgi:hypothetical protein